MTITEKKQFLKKLLEKGKHGVRVHLAQAVGVSPKTIYLWANGTQWPKEDQERQVWEFFGVRLDEIPDAAPHPPSSGKEHPLPQTPAPAADLPFDDWLSKVEQTRRELGARFSSMEKANAIIEAVGSIVASHRNAQQLHRSLAETLQDALDKVRKTIQREEDIVHRLLEGMRSASATSAEEDAGARYLRTLMEEGAQALSQLQPPLHPKEGVKNHRKNS
jgi:DNA-binding XRE family transcriptional regulator